MGKLARTQDEIVERIELRRGRDLLGFEISEYIGFLDFDHARPYLKPETTKEEWPTDGQADPIQTMCDYMPFAWGKANDCRGISANRSVYHCIAWLWLASEEDELKWIETEGWSGYQHYGKEILAHICEHFGWDWKLWDNGRWVNSEDE